MVEEGTGVPVSGSFLVEGGTVFDGERVHPATPVLVLDGRIAAVGGRPAPPGRPVGAVVEEARWDRCRAASWWRA